MPLSYGSVCSGIEAATVAWHSLGWRPAFFAEIEAFPCAVLHHHYDCGRPKTLPDGQAPTREINRLPARGDGPPNLGDFTKIGEGDCEPIDRRAFLRACKWMGFKPEAFEHSRRDLRNQVRIKRTPESEAA